MSSVAEIEMQRRKRALARTMGIENDFSPYVNAVNLLSKVICELKGYRLTHDEVNDLIHHLDDLKITVKCMEEGL